MPLKKAYELFFCKQFFSKGRYYKCGCKNINPELAKQFLYRIREAKSYIAIFPQGFPVKYKEVRTLLLKQFPYHIHYLVNDVQKQIIILAIVHAYKNPQDNSTR